MVEMYITLLNFSVHFIHPILYSPSIVNIAAKVPNTACTTIPGYALLKYADIPPKNNPSQSAYNGANILFFVKHIINANMKPTIAPTVINILALSVKPAIN